MSFARVAVLGFGLAFVGCSAANDAPPPPPNIFPYMETKAEHRDVVTGPESLGGTMRFKSEVCKDEPLAPDFTMLTEQSLTKFLTAHKFEIRSLQARGDLIYVDVVKDGKMVRLRVAILKSTHEAGRELHEAILQHGPGSWGVHRSNLAVLGPVGSLDQILTFVTDTKLACWGVVTAAGRDDTFVIPGAYTEI
jgi:hypothetical protein